VRRVVSIDRSWVIVVCRQDQGEAEVEKEGVESPKKVEWEWDVLVVSFVLG